jgi:DNA primase
MSKKLCPPLTGETGKRPDFAAIKAAADLVAVIESHGVALKKEGRDYVGLCPFHDDKTPSLRVTPGKGLWRCMGCEAAGNVIQFVAKKENLTDREAALRLLGSLPGVQTASQLEKTKRGSAEMVAPEARPRSESAGVSGAGRPLGGDANKPSSPAVEPVAVPPNVAADLLARVAGFYARTLHKDRAGLDYLAGRGLAQPAMLEAFRVGYCNGTLKTALPQAGEVVTQLQALGVLNAKGNEVFYGRVVVPILDAAGGVVGLYGRKVEGEGARLNADSARHIYLGGSHRAAFNAGAARHAARLVFTEAIFDALALWQAGETGAVPLYGADGFTEHHAALVREMSAAEILLALDADDKGRAGAEALRVRLAALAPAVPVRVVAWPEGAKDAAEFCTRHEDARAGWAALLAPPAPASTPTPEATAGKEDAGKGDDEPQEEANAQGFALVWPGRRYEVVALARAGVARLKATVKAIGGGPGRFHVEALDLYSARARRLFAGEAARVFRVPVELAENDLARLLAAAERRCEQPAGTGSGEKTPALSAQDRSEATKLGRAADLVGEIQRDLGKLGIIGEETNRLLLYLALTSRRMLDPLAVQVLAGSGAGKSHLQDAVLSLCPEEDLIKLTSLSNQALFYKGEDSLKHKCLAVEEVAGAAGARYALRNLISAKKLTIETTVKNPATGRMETQVNTVNGPTAVFETTTDPQGDPETKSRFIITSIDESPEQTRAIIEAQRNRHTLDGMRARHARAEVLRRHHAFQRTLRTVEIVNPYEPLLGYGDDRLAFRRDHPKYLHLILAVTFLHQLQRPVRRDAGLGIDYIETTLDDIAIANDLAAELFGASVDDLSRPGRELLERTAAHVQAKAERTKTTPEKVEFTRRELREALGWSEYQLRTHLHELAELEYIVSLSGRYGATFTYRLLWSPEEGGRFVPGLKSVEQLRKDAAKLGIGNGVGSSSTSLEKTQPRAEKTNLGATSLNPSNEVKTVVFTSGNGRNQGNLGAVNGAHIRTNGHERSHA